MKVATLCAGYGDGFDRHLSGQEADVLIKGRRCRLLGRVTMDQIMVDVTHLDSVEPGDEVVLIGRQGDQEILASELATKAGTIAWEIFTGITKRVVRVYLGARIRSSGVSGRLGAVVSRSNRRLRVIRSFRESPSSRSASDFCPEFCNS